LGQQRSPLDRRLDPTVRRHLALFHRLRAGCSPLAAFLNLRTLASPDHFLGWFCGIVLNHCRMLRRRQRRTPGTQPVEEREMASDGGVEAAVEGRALLAQVSAAVRTLPEAQKQAAMLVFLAGWTPSEAAAALGISRAALKVRLHRARQALRSQLTGPEEKPAPRRRRRRWNVVELEVFDVDAWLVDTEEGTIISAGVILLRERGGSRLLWLPLGEPAGEPVATSIAFALEGYHTVGPMTRDLAADLLEATGAIVESVTINRLTDRTFYATVAVKRSRAGRTVEVNARPSDAVKLALRTKAPIFVEEEVLAQASPKVRAIKSEGPPGSALLVEYFKKRRRMTGIKGTEEQRERMIQALRETGVELGEE
jgi:RNA polymerase sigma factor (sigma-70 family)